MPQFKVHRYNMGIWDKQDPQDVVASSAKEAAEKACGERLIAAGALVETASGSMAGWVSAKERGVLFNLIGSLGGT
jgi:hypothetical protein